MSWPCGIIGLPNAGKTTVFNALTTGYAEVASYPLSAIAPKAEVISFADLARPGSAAKVREVGRLHSEGRDYLVQDGDILLFRFQR